MGDGGKISIHFALLDKRFVCIRHWSMAIFIALLTSSCTLFKEKHAEFSVTQAITQPNLQNIVVYTQRPPIDNAYRFVFKNDKQERFSLLLFVNRTDSFASSLEYVREDIAISERTRIDQNATILSTLKKKLPPEKQIDWQSISDTPTAEAQEAYQTLLQFIRIRYQRMTFS